MGDYELLDLLHESEDTQTFVARQRSIDRTVALVLLKAHRRADPDAVEAFGRGVQAKARVSHPRIAAVYESGEENGWLYYTREVVNGADLTTLRAEGHRLSLEVVWSLLRTVCDTFLYYEENQIGYRAFRPEALVLIHEEPYLANLATADPADPEVFAPSLAAIRESFWRLFRAEDTHLEDVQVFFARMDPHHPRVFRTWSELKRACNVAARVAASSSGPRLVTPVSKEGLEDAAAVKEDRAEATTLAVAQTMSRLMTFMVVLLTGVAAAAGWWWWDSRRSVPPVDNAMVRIPAGSFRFQEDQWIGLPEFWITKYEITIGQYAEFLVRIGESRAFDHVDQPDSKGGHEPAEWRVYYPAALTRGRFRGQSLTINCPVMGVDWWDAHAYAHWRKGRLPKADEWEKAARGTEGFLYPWGSTFDSSKANTGIDFKKSGGGGGRDGFNAWAPVDALPTDVSPYGVMGLLGNVSEWTGTLGADAANSGREVPIVKGASFLTGEGLALTHGRLSSPDDRSLSRGFRIAADAVR